MVGKSRFARAGSRRKAILYARFSDQPGAKDSFTIQAQYTHCVAYCEKEGWEIVYRDKDEFESGTMMGRRGLDACIAKTKAVRGVLVCYSLSRMTRNTKDALDILDDLEVHGCDLVLLDILIDTTTFLGRALFTIAATFSELTAAQGAKVTSDSLRAYQKDRWMVSKHCPYGWKPGDETKEFKSGNKTKLRRRMVPDEKEQLVLTIILDCKAQGWSDGKIINHLKLLGYRTRKGTDFDRKRIYTIVQREMRDGNPARVTANPKYVMEHVGGVKQGVDDVDTGQSAD